MAAQRVSERLDRGLVAIARADGSVYFSWRLLANEPVDMGFHVYCRRGADSVRLTAQPVVGTCDFLCASPPQGAMEYYLTGAAQGQEVAMPGALVAASSVQPRPYLSIKLDGDHTFQKVAIADLDGDGRYDFLIKQPDQNVDPYKGYWKRSSGTYKLEAYRSDGKFLWRHDLGWAIEQGIWYSPYVVYDLDGDGRAEVAAKTGEGDPRDTEGRVQTGPEYLSILDGLTGKELTRIDWPSREGFSDYNYYCRNQLAVAYLDGKTPCLLVNRGTYNTIKLAAYQYHDKRLRLLWSWTDSEDGPKYRGQGAHCIRVADVDEDGRDEIILGSAVIDDNGQGLWSTGMGHPDHVYVGDLDPSRPGLEIYYGMETRQQRNGLCMVDATTGRIIWGYDQPTRHVHGQGLCSDIDARHPGWECYGADTDAEKKFAWSILYDCQGRVISREDLGGFAPRAAYWDADTQRELIQKGQLRKFAGPVIDLRIEGTIVAVADILGDWREEIITSLPGELRIYCTTIPATDRRRCLMLDPIYRLDVATASQGYYQIPGLRSLSDLER